MSHGVHTAQKYDTDVMDSAADISAKRHIKNARPHVHETDIKNRQFI